MHSTENTFNIVSFLFENAKKFPKKNAIIDQNKQITYSELAQEVLQTSYYFQQKGIKKGDKVLVFVGMSIDLYRIVMALFHIGAIAVFLDAWVGKKRLEECCRVVDCQAFVGVLKARFLAIFSKELQKIPIKLGLSFKHKKQVQQTDFEELTYANDTALITFTTGSTGTPKGAIRTHGILYAQFRALIDKIQPQEHEINMPTLPIMLFINLAGGITSVIEKTKFKHLNENKIGKILEKIYQKNVNSLIASPYFVKKLAEYSLKNQINTAQIQKIFTGGAPIFAQEAELYLQAFPNAHIEIVYGSTEAEPISSILAKNIKNTALQGLSVGKIDKNVQVKIIDLPANSHIGEIIVSGDHVLQHYFNNPDAEQKNKIWIQNVCWHRTGDSGHLNEKNELFLMGRCDNIIKYKDQFIYPFIYENILLQVQFISMATILEINEKIIIAIELKNKKNQNQVIEIVKSLDIPHHEVKFIKKIPRDLRHYAKIDYQKLKYILS